MNKHEHKQKESFWQKIRHNHYFMILTCVVPIILLLGANYAFGWKSNNLLLFVFLLACMIGHMFMMQNHKNH